MPPSSHDLSPSSGGQIRWTDEGGPVSPVLSNIYLHYVLDLWFERRFKKSCRGYAELTRFADDFVAAFQDHGDAERFRQEMEGHCQVDERRWSRGRAGWLVGRWLAGSRNRGDFAPGLALLVHQPTVGGCGEAMAPWAEVVADGAEGLQEALRLLR